MIAFCEKFLPNYLQDTASHILEHEKKNNTKSVSLMCSGVLRLGVNWPKMDYRDEL